MSKAAAFVRAWFTEPAPTFELRTPSARWGKVASHAARRELRVVEVVDETPSTRTFVLEPTGTARPLVYEAGQHLTLLVDIAGVTHRRCYSFSSSPASGLRPAITVKRMPEGVVSRHLHERVRAGDTLVATDPSGQFTLATNPARAAHDCIRRRRRRDHAAHQPRRDTAARGAAEPRGPPLRQSLRGRDHLPRAPRRSRGRVRAAPRRAARARPAARELERRHRRSRRSADAAAARRDRRRRVLRLRPRGDDDRRMQRTRRRRRRSGSGTHRAVRVRIGHHDPHPRPLRRGDVCRQRPSCHGETRPDDPAGGTRGRDRPALELHDGRLRRVQGEEDQRRRS